MTRTALITNEGFTDLLELGRQNRADPYQLCTHQSSWVQRIPRTLRWATAARIDAHGNELHPLDTTDLLEQIAHKVSEIDSIAVCLLFAWMNPSHESAIAQAIQMRFPQLRVAVSHTFSDLRTEYERCVRTVESLQAATPVMEAVAGSPTTVIKEACDTAQFTRALDACANHMQAVLVDQAVSSIAREAMDCAAAVFLADGRLIAQAHSLPLLLGSLSPAVRGLLAQYPTAGMRPGDGFVLNHPWHGGTHLPDLTVVRPVFAGEQLVGLLACILHHQDVGGMVAGSLPSAATNVHQEGLLIPPVRLYAQDALQSDLHRLLLANSRTPDNLAGDLKAQWTALLAGELMLQRLHQ